MRFYDVICNCNFEIKFATQMSKVDLFVHTSLPKIGHFTCILGGCPVSYGWAMSQYLPTGGFNWCDEKSNEEWEEIIKSLKDDDDKGFFFEVDLEYPKELHDEHDTFPCAPEKISVQESMLSPYQRELGEKLGVKFGSEKLCLTLQHKTKYVL